MGKIRFLIDSGPIIHISEINAENIWNTFSLIIIPDIVLEEVSFKNKPGANILENKHFNLSKTNNDIITTTKRFLNKYKLEKNDSIILGHLVFHKAKYILTDDLEIRKIAEKEGIIPVGTIGILLRSLRKGYFTKGQVIEFLDRILIDSSLFITKNIVDDVKKIVLGYKPP